MNTASCRGRLLVVHHVIVFVFKFVFVFAFLSPQYVSGEPGCWRSGGGFCSPIPLPGSTPAPRSTSCPRTPRPRQPAVDGGKPARYPSPASKLAFAGFSDFQPRSHHLLMIFFGQWVTNLSFSGSTTVPFSRPDICSNYVWVVSTYQTSWKRTKN